MSTTPNPIVTRAAAGTSEDKAIHAHVSDHAHDQWHGWAAEQGLPVSALRRRNARP